MARDRMDGISCAIMTPSNVHDHEGSKASAARQDELEASLLLPSLSSVSLTFPSSSQADATPCPLLRPIPKKDFACSLVPFI